MTSRLKDFVRMNPPVFLGSKVGEDLQEFLDGVYKVLSAIDVTSGEKVDLDIPIEGSFLSMVHPVER